MFWWVIWWHDSQSQRPLRQDKQGHYFLISHLLFVLQYFYHNFESCCWTIYTNRKIILHDVFVQLQSIFNSTNINHGQSYYFLISHLLFVLQYFYHNFESCCWTIYTNRKIILHDVFVQLQSIFNSTNINHGQSYPIFGFWLKYIYLGAGKHPGPLCFGNK